MELFMLNKRIDINGISFDIIAFDEIDSTSSYLKACAENGADERTVVIAKKQSCGRGRMGRSFLSGEGGLYMSILMRPKKELNSSAKANGILVTACAAVAVSEAIEAVTGKKTDIKWVNDLYYNGKKVCGILAESAFDEKGEFEYIVLGIGINLLSDFSGTEVEKIATSLFGYDDNIELNDIKDRLIYEILASLYRRYKNELAIEPCPFIDDYKSKLFIIGKEVDTQRGGNLQSARVLSLNDDFTLQVRFSDGSEAALNSGEVRLRVIK